MEPAKQPLEASPGCALPLWHADDSPHPASDQFIGVLLVFPVSIIQPLPCIVSCVADLPAHFLDYRPSFDLTLSDKKVCNIFPTGGIKFPIIWRPFSNFSDLLVGVSANCVKFKVICRQKFVCMNFAGI
jgi:hypothetical protein